MDTMNTNTIKIDFDLSRLDDDEYITSKNVICKQKYDTTILKYNRDHLTQSNVNTLGLFRSVIIKNGAFVSFAPPKSYKADSIQETYNSEELISQLTFEEYVEGTMINVFYDGSEWEIASRSMVGAKGQFYKGSKTFRRMFLEAMNNCSIEFEYLNKEYCYSFVFQHPENRIVVSCKNPKLYLCEVYKITGDIVEIIDFRKDETLCSHVNIPTQYDDIKSWEEVMTRFSHKETTPYYVMGVIIKNGFIRSKVRNPNYIYVRELRGNQPKLQFQYYHLRQIGRVGDYLSYYPEHADEFNKFRQHIHDFTKNLHSYYIQCYCNKEKPLKDFPYEFRTHMYTLHQHYLDNLREEGKIVTVYEAMTYINTLEPARLMYTMNYKLRQLTKKTVTVSPVETHE